MSNLTLEHYDSDGNLIPGQTGGAIPLSQGGTGSNLSATGPGALVQATLGADVTVEILDETRGGTAQSTFTQGDILYSSAANVLAKLAIGTAGFFLKVVGGVPAWAAVAYQILKKAGSAIAAQPILNFLDGPGISITLTDDNPNTETEVLIGLSLDIQENGVSKVATPDTINFVDSNVEAPGGNNADVYQDLPGLSGGRLTGTTGVPVTTADVTGVTTLYYTPYIHDKISLYDGTRWKKFTFSEVSLALTGLIKGVVYDIFGYDSSGLTLEALAWKKVTATNSPTAGASKTINLSDTTGLAVGMEVTVRDGSASEVTNITTVNSGVSIVVDNLVNGYTLPDVYGYPTRATAVTRQDGVYVKSGDTTRRLLGSIRIDRATTGQTQDSATERLIANVTNRARKHMFCTDGTDSWSYNSTIRAANASVAYGVGRNGFVSCLGDALAIAQNYAIAFVSGAGDAVGGVGLDTTAVNHAQFGGAIRSTVNATVPMLSQYAGYPGIGNHYLQRVEAGNTAGGITWYGDNGGAYADVGMMAYVEV